MTTVVDLAERRLKVGFICAALCGPHMALHTVFNEFQAPMERRSPVKIILMNITLF